MNKKYKDLFKDTVILAIGNFASKLILFLLVPLYTNYLSTAEFGVAELISTISQLIIPFASLEINSAILRFSMKKDEKKEDVVVTSSIVLVLTLIVSIVLIPLFGLFNTLADWKVYLSMLIIGPTVLECEKSYLKAANKNKEFSIISFIQTLIMGLANVILIKYVNLGIKGYLLANILACYSMVIITYFVADLTSAFSKGKINKSLLRQMIYYSSPLILNNVSWWIINSSDKIMIETMINASELGLYTIASKIPALINVIVSIFISAWGLSSIKEIENNQDNSFINSVFSHYTALVFGAGIFFVTFSKEFMNIYVGAGFQDSWKYVPLLLCSAVFYSISAFFGSLYSAIQRTVNNMWTTVLCAVVNVILNILLIPKIGVWGAVVGTVVAYITIAIVRMIDVSKYLKLSLSVTKLIVNVALLIVQTACIFIRNDYIYHIFSVVLLLFVFNNMSSVRVIITIIKTKYISKRGK